MTTQGYILGLLLACWAIVLGYQLVFTEPTQHIPLVNRTTNSSHNPPTQSTIALHIQNLLKPRNPSDEISEQAPKNIFAPLRFSTPTKPKPRFIPKPIKAQPSKPVERPQAPPLDLLAQNARNKMAEYRFLGFVHEGGRTKVFLVNDQEIFIVGERDVLKDDIRVVKIRQNSIQLQYLDTNIRTTIPVSDSSISGKS